jgi:hypothetical protein
VPGVKGVRVVTLTSLGALERRPQVLAVRVPSAEATRWPLRRSFSSARPVVLLLRSTSAIPEYELGPCIVLPVPRKSPSASTTELPAASVSTHVSGKLRGRGARRGRARGGSGRRGGCVEVHHKASAAAGGEQQPAALGLRLDVASGLGPVEPSQRRRAALPAF